MIRNNSVLKVTGYELGDRISISSRNKVFSSPSRKHRLWGPPNGALSSGLKWSENEADDSFPPSTEVINVSSFTFTPLIHLNGIVHKHKETFASLCKSILSTEFFFEISTACCKREGKADIGHAIFHSLQLAVP
jgi:hypothetical protein